ncbi:hypothetical protein HBI12_055130 [Parastagonospora nodorum]|nr:hypothetical protein HBI12_055130 [Parastagonospora nodorum]
MASPALDHLILFVPVDPETNLPKVPNFFTKNFTLTPGGVHADGITSNTLILFADGCYIELISFIDPFKAASHWWGPDASFVGWKDWCLTNSKTLEENYEGIKETHDKPVHGGRKRADGVDVKWAVTFPKGENGGQKTRGRIPFFCHDITDRSIRVPLSKENTTHPCGALGITQLSIIARDQDLLDETKKALTSLLDEVELGAPSFRAARVRDVEGLDSGAKIAVRLPHGEEETETVTQTGFWFGDICLGVKATGEHAPGMKVRLDLDAEDVRGVSLKWV